MFKFLNIFHFFLIITTSVTALYGEDYWLRQNSPTGKTLYKCFFADSIYGWASGDSGIIIHTSNAGANWSIQQSGITDYKIEELFFLNRRLGWAISNNYQFTGTNILITTNGGFNWINSLFPDPDLVFNTIFFLDSLSGFISGQSGVIYRTTNGGADWLRCGIDSTECPHLLPKQDLFFINSSTGFSCGGAIDYTGVVWKTINGGLNWAPFCLTPEPLNVIKQIGINKIVLMGGDFDFGANVVYSANNGISWNYELTGCFGYVTGFSLRTPAECWAVLGAAQLMAVNLDSIKPGTSWQCLPSPESEELYDIEFTSPTFGWAFGSRGSIFKYNSAIIGINGNHNNIPLAIRLYQNYPNPFNPVTIINYELRVTGYVKLVIYDAKGKEISSLINKEQSPGNYLMEWDGTNFPSGIYFCRMTAGSFSRTVKMVLLK